MGTSWCLLPLHNAIYNSQTLDFFVFYSLFMNRQTGTKSNKL